MDSGNKMPPKGEGGGVVVVVVLGVGIRKRSRK